MQSVDTQQFCICCFRQQLPSFLHRNVTRNSKKGKNPKITHYNHDIICLPQSYAKQICKSIPIPHGKAHTILAEMGLQGEVSLRSDMLEETINCEIHSAFAEVEYDFFPFVFLQVSGSSPKNTDCTFTVLLFLLTAVEVGKLWITAIYRTNCAMKIVRYL